jgi:hypothetical protein
MPRNQQGEVADVIVDACSTIRRTNYGRFNEHYINATTSMIENQCRSLLSQNRVEEATQLLFDYYKVVSPLMYDKALDILPTDQDKINHCIEACQEGLQIWLPPDSPSIGYVGIKALTEQFPLKVGPVIYRQPNGKWTQTANDILIGSMYYVLLEKIGDDWGATSIPKRQHHGIPGKLTDQDKSYLPWRDQAFKIFGESEVRCMFGALDPMFVSSMVAFPNSPAMCEDAALTILTAPQPTNVDMVMDYAKHAKQQGRANQYFNHILNTSGVKLVQGEI